jgi:RNA polymerase sigma-70 factor (ECF subfamily)
MPSAIVKSNSILVDAPPSTTPRSADAASGRSGQAPQRALEEGFVAREAWAFEAAYMTYRRLLYGAAYGVLRDAAESEDCVHDVLVRLWQRGHAYTRVRGSLQAFLCVCVRNEALSRRRRSTNRGRIEREKLDAVAVVPAVYEAALNRVDVAKALESLSQAQRQAIQLAYFEGLTHEQIAQRLDEPVGTEKSRLSNALRGLRAVFSRGEQP